MKKMVLVLSIGLMVLGCASLPETMKKRDDAEKSIIGVSVVTKAPIAIFKDVNTRVFFIKVEKKDQMFKGTDLRAGNFQKGNYVYLVNAEPGMYVVVASNFEKKGQVYHTYFNKEAISATLMEVRPADIAFMGEITTRNEASLSGIFLNNIGEKADEAQKHYHTLLNTMGIVNLGFIYSGKLESRNVDAQVQQRFINDAREVFKQSEWEDIIKNKK
ncbi:MAG: hypothetical protein KBA61_03540 [Spirochaetes bacterium]|nr:hypothetical protein [Spirochaetota bacterium]HPA73527.1 hypothetical protein [Spirochaetota bacterium]